MRTFKKVRELVKNSLPFLAVISSIITYSFYTKLDYYIEDFFFKGNIFTINLLTFYIFLQDKNRYHINFLFKLLLCETSFMHLIKEFTGKADKLYLIEVIIATCIPFLWYFSIKLIKNDSDNRILERD